MDYAKVFKLSVLDLPVLTAPIERSKFQVIVVKEWKDECNSSNTRIRFIEGKL